MPDFVNWITFTYFIYPFIFNYSFVTSTMPPATSLFYVMQPVAGFEMRYGEAILSVFELFLPRALYVPNVAKWSI